MTDSLDGAWQNPDVEFPKHISRGDYAVTGTQSYDTWSLMKSAGMSVESGSQGVSGIYETERYITGYDDISGISGCLGATLRKLETSDQTWPSGIGRPLTRRKIGMIHEGYIKLTYKSGTLDGTVQTLRYGDAIAPCSYDGFRAYEDVNVKNVTGATDEEIVLTTGERQCKLGWLAEPKADTTGTDYLVKLMPNHIYGGRP